MVLLKLVDLLAVDMLLHFGPANGLFLFEDMGAVALLKNFNLLAVDLLLCVRTDLRPLFVREHGPVALLNIFDLLAVDLLLCVRADLRPLLCEPENKGAAEPRKYFALLMPRLPNNFAALSVHMCFTPLARALRAQ